MTSLFCESPTEFLYGFVLSALLGVFFLNPHANFPFNYDDSPILPVKKLSLDKVRTLIRSHNQ